MIKVAPSILSGDFACMKEAVINAEKWGADYIHFDVMDGSFVPNITFGPAMCEAVRKYTSLPLDVHLMVENPSKWIQPFKDAGAGILTFHVEAEKHCSRTLQLIKQAGMKAGVVLNPATGLDTVEYLIEDCDMILLMSVNPGAGGQKFIASATEKIRCLREMADKKGTPLDIEVDGGINTETGRLCANAGANILVAGSAIYNAENPESVVRQLKGL